MDDLFWHLEHDSAPMVERRGSSADDYAAFEAWQVARLERDMQIALEIRLLENREFVLRKAAKFRKDEARRLRRWLIAGWIAMCLSAAVFACLVFSVV